MDNIYFIQTFFQQEIIFRYIIRLAKQFYSYRVYQLRSTESQRVSDQDLVDEKLRSTESQRVSDLQLSDEKVSGFFYCIDCIDNVSLDLLHG
jgi:hypothetical protein